MSGHTEGPWEARKIRLDFEIVGPNGEDIGFANCSDGADEPTEYPAEANANLMAAAPDLYDIAQLVIGSLPSNDPLMREIRRRAEAAVAKAEGRS